MGKNGNSDRIHFLGRQNHCGQWLQLWKWKVFTPWKKSYDKPRQCIKKQRHHFADKGLSSQSYGFNSSNVQLDHKEGWVPQNWCFQIVVLEKTLVSSFDIMDIKPVNTKGNQPWIFIGRTEAKLKLPICPLDGKSRLIRTNPDAGKDWRQAEKGTTEDEVVGWHHRLNGHGFEPAQGAGQYRTGKPGVLLSMGLERVGHNWATKQ